MLLTVTLVGLEVTVCELFSDPDEVATIGEDERDSDDNVDCNVPMETVVPRLEPVMKLDWGPLLIGAPLDVMLDGVMELTVTSGILLGEFAVAVKICELKDCVLFPVEVKVADMELELVEPLCVVLGVCSLICV